MTAQYESFFRTAWDREPLIGCSIPRLLHGQTLDLRVEPFAGFEPRIRPRHPLCAV